MTVIEYHRKYFDHIINVNLIGKEKKGIVILCCHSERYQSHTCGIKRTKAIKRIIIKASVITLHTSSCCGLAAVGD